MVDRFRSFVAAVRALSSTNTWLAEAMSSMGTCLRSTTTCGLKVERHDQM